MSWKNKLSVLSLAPAISWFDFFILSFLIIGGSFYLHDLMYWGIGYIGDAPYGDAQFWWSGAVHVARGIFQDNPGKGFRPGYFVLSGLTLPVIGEQFKQFFPYFMVVFLFAAGMFYLALRQSLGRWASACVVGMLIFNPYTAEWLATSTTDSMGLLLNLVAISCLLFGVNNGLRKGWLIAFAIFFALATLTRPLITPFIGLVVLTILFLVRAPFKKRATLVFWIIVAFCLPTFLWMGVQKLTIDRWSISSNDASAFYAASDPKIQVWNPTIGDQISKVAAEYYHVPITGLSDQQINHIYWDETLKNYFKYPKYHFKRLGPHIWQIASFTPKMATHGTDLLRILFLDLIAAGLSLWLLIRKRWARAVVIASLGVMICFIPSVSMMITIAGAIVALLPKRNPNQQLGIFLLSLFWLTGIAALYLVGATWGPPSFTPYFTLNALGYRLGSQIFFAGDLLAGYFFVWATLVNLHEQKILSAWEQQMYRPASFAGGIVLGVIGVFCTLAVVVYTIGTGIVIHRTFARSHLNEESYPALNSVIEQYNKRTGVVPQFVEGEKGGFNKHDFALLNSKKSRKDLVFTGTTSPFIWNMPDQQRAQIMVHTQEHISPYTMGPGFVILELPSHVAANDWDGVQGVFFIRNFPNRHNGSNQPYYYTSPSVRAFVPLASNKKSYDITKIRWFPLVKNAAQLETSGELQFKDAKITWADSSGSVPYQRRFFVDPKVKGNSSGTVELLVDVSKARQPAELSFSYAASDEPAVTHKGMGKYDMTVVSIGNNSKQFQAKIDHALIPAAGTDASLKKIVIPIKPGIKTVKISFKKLLHGTGVWIYEFNLSAADFT